ncbi:non-ribosomal peptide synthetase [Cladorrhinum sp. PSN332]|nr:non-ribosomal peptide synthetase [Cladorrhinum sp. PSN332]
MPHSPRMSNDITRKSFWTQRLQAVEASSSGQSFFDQPGGAESYARTKAVNAVDANNLKQAASMHGLSEDTIIVAAWAVLLRSYAGEDGSVSFGVCLDREQTAWLSTMAMSSDDKLLSMMRVAEQDMKLTLDHTLTFHSLGAFSEGTGFSEIATAVYIHSWKSRFPDMHLPSKATAFVNVMEGTMVHVHLSYRKDVLSTQQAQSVTDNFAHTLNALTAKLRVIGKHDADEVFVKSIDTVSRNDYSRIVEFSSALPQKLNDCVHNLILTRCNKPENSHRLAVSAWDGDFTYAELAKQALRLAGMITSAAHQIDVPIDGRQIFVPFYLTKSKWTPVAILAILAAGGACVPLEPSHPAARRNDILAQVNAPIVLTNSSFRDALAQTLAPETSVKHIICVDRVEVGHSISTSSPSVPLPYVKPDALCYVIFTSGSTGSPKGVKWQHSALATSTWEHGREFHMNERSRVLQFASHVFDVSVVELVTPLIHGGCVVIPSDQERVDPDSLSRFMEKMGVNCALFAASYARLLKPQNVPTLKTLVLGGEGIGQDNIDRWTPTLDRFIIGYGSAETCINCAKNEFSLATKSTNPWKESLGRAIGGRMLIADRSNRDRLAPIGAVGEIIVEGPILAQGYLNDTDKTSRSFIENPAWVKKTHFYPSSSRRRFYRTGDLGRQGIDGQISFMGRADFQVKIRGQRMELEEIRFHIVKAFPEAVDVHVDVISAQGEKALTAFISFGAATGPQGEVEAYQPDETESRALREMLRVVGSHLPAAAVPSFFILVTAFPSLVSGKIDRRRLLEFANHMTIQQLSLSFAQSSTRPDSNVPSTPQSTVEEVLLSCCRDILRYPSLGVTDSFISSGGDSIAAIKVAGAARSRGILVTVADIFQTSSIRALAQAAIASDELTNDDELDIPLALSLLPGDLVDEIVSGVKARGTVDDQVLDVYPCSPLQEALITVSSMRAGAYVARHTLELSNHIDVEHFKEAWCAVVQRHDLLRTRIYESEHGAVQVVYDSDPEWHTAASAAAYVELDRSTRMAFGDNLVRLGLVGRTFFFTIHHSLFDGWSITQLFEDVERAYAGLKPLSLQPYKVFIRHLSDSDDTGANRFWSDNLLSNSGLAACHFPQTMSSSYTPIPDSELTVKVAVADNGKSDFTMPTRIRAAWALLVGRYLDSHDIIFGETLSGRACSLKHVESIAGPTISTVPVRITWSAADSLENLLRQIQSDMLQIEVHGNIGIQNIQRLSQSASEGCQFQHIVVIQPKRSSMQLLEPSHDGISYPRIGLDKASLDLRGYHSYSLNMDFALEDDGVKVTTTFDSKVFSKDQISHLQAQFSHVLSQICRSQGREDVTIDSIDYASRKDRELQITNNRQPLQYAHTTLLHELQRHVSARPNAAAVDAWDGSFTYQELDRAASNLAHQLSALGVRQGDYVPYCFSKSMWATVAILGALKLGAISVALEPSHPDSSISKVLHLVKPKVVLCAPAVSARIKNVGYRPFVVEQSSLSTCSISQSSMKHHTTPQPHDTAFVVFTSGSTGEPKGIPLEHNAVCIMAKQHGEAMNINKDSRILQFAAHVFDVSIGDLAIAIYYGACLCVPNDEERMNNLAHAINTLRANRAWLTPTVACLISPKDCPTMEWLSVGGEQLTQSCKDIWNGVPLVNVYGPAEVTNIGTALLVTPETPITNIGHANGTRVWVCEPGNPQKLAPTGCIGEIIFEGPNVGQGYLDNPELTRSAFPNILPWVLGNGQEEPVRMYRTGDLARLNIDGSIDFQGRRDTQIKLRGQRIEITAVETALRESVDEPVELAVDILGVSTTGRDASLIAFLHLPERLNEHANISLGLFNNALDLKPLVNAIRSRVSQTLPPHMIPTLFIALNYLPKLVSGKIDRKSLRLAASKLTDEEVALYKLDQRVEKALPSTAQESQMLKLWAAVLRLSDSEIGVDDNFVALGGDSITAIKLVALGRSQGLSINVSSIFQHGTISALCASFSSSNKAAEDGFSGPKHKIDHPHLLDIALQCKVAEDEIEDIFPCTALQEGMMIMTEQNPTAYVAHHIMELPQWVDLAVFLRTWQAITDEHPILRTRLVPSGSQVVLRPGPLQWTAFASDNISAYIQQVRKEKIGFGTALTQQTVLKNPLRFVWTAHHCVYDGWSMSLLAEQISKRYREYSGLPRTVMQAQEEPTISFKSFVEHISAVDKSEANQFWSAQLDGTDPPSFPPSIPSSYQALADTMLEATISFPRHSKSTFTTSTFIRTAWAILISAYTGSHQDVVYGIAVTGRSVPLDGVLGLIGPTLATVPFRMVLDFGETVKELLSRVQHRSFDMLEFEQYGLQHIRKSSPTAPAACDFQSLLVVHPEVKDTASQTDFAWSSDRSAADFLTNALTMECQPTKMGLSLTASYDSSIMDDRQMRRMISAFEHILGQICQGERDARLRLDDIDVVSPQDRREISQITQNLPPRVDDRVHDMFARQAAATPTALAVSAWDGDLTYIQLHQLSSKLALHLRSLGVGPECFTPFCLEKSKWVPVTQLAILKAGGACVPLDPGQPLDRLQSIISTLEPKVIVTSAMHANLLKSCTQVQSFVEVSQTLMDQLPKTDSPSTNPETSPSSACYAIFTSGSTGTPKGVIWEHSALCTSMTEHGAAFNYSTDTRVLQFSSHTFDVSVSELLTTLVFGGCVCIPDDFTRLNGISAFMNEKHVNWTFFAPSFARLMDPTTVPGLKTIVLGGEAPGKDNIERWSGRPGLELIVTYGPAESSIYCAKNSVQGPQVDGSIGHSIGGMMWVADLGRPALLAPVGAVGEIVVEGNILARGYLKDPAKTAAAFRSMPARWAGGRSTRVYFTGDLGRVNTDGTISCLGRRDDQVKIRGQRVELPDIEYHLRKDERVRQALVLYPRFGPCANHLVGILAMARSKPKTGPASSTDITLASSDDWEEVPEIQDRLSQRVPVYMIPAIWIVLNSIPMMPASQKVNRKMVSEWTKEMDQPTYEHVAALSSGSASDEIPVMETQLQEKVRGIWCEILNVGPQTIGPNTSFLRLGGDSISAMQVITRCRSEGINVAVQDLLKSKTISDFSKRAEACLAAPNEAEEFLEDEAETDTPFALSPMQEWFMKLAPSSHHYFNQSHLLRFTTSADFEKVQSALLVIVKQHPMLRARFQQVEGAWEQHISSDAAGSLQCRLFQSVRTMQTAVAYASDAQASLNIATGPLIAADVYRMTDGVSVLFITCHHMVIDLVSWRVVLKELEDILRTGHLPSAPRSLSFRTWCRLLEEQPQPIGLELPAQDLGFWGVTSGENTFAQVIEQGFSLDTGATELLMGDSNAAFNTEPLDILLAAVLHSFNEIFGEIRGPVTAFNEGHGREPWRSDIDLSSTVGWFTAMCPIFLSDHGGDVLRSLKEVKDARRQVPGKGLPFFKSFANGSTSAVEITFNYFGLYQQLERHGALFNRMTWAPFNGPSDSSPNVPRFSLFDVSAGVEDGVLTMNFAFSNRIKHMHLVQQWVDSCSDTLHSLIQATSSYTGPSLTLVDLPHVQSTYDELSTLFNTILPESGVSPADVENIYPCSPMQTALLVSQALDPALYAVRYVWAVSSKTAEALTAEKLASAWREVVKAHPMLRTVFVQTTSSVGSRATAVYTQVVLKRHEPAVQICGNATQFPVGQPQDHIYNGPPHHLILLPETSGVVKAQLDISHALIDGTSVSILLDSFAKAYGESLDIGSAVQDAYGSYVGHLNKQNLDSSRHFWKTYLGNAEPCLFPSLQMAPPSQSLLEHLHFAYPGHARLHSVCTKTETTVASVFKLAWALILQTYTGNNYPCFGFLASGRDLPIDGIDKAVGPFINMLVCMLPLEEDGATVESVLKTAHSDYVNSLSHQLCSLAEIQRSLGFGGSRMFNTALSVQRLAQFTTSSAAIEFQQIDAEDPSEFDIALNIGDAPDFVDVSLAYNTALICAQQAKRIASAFNHAIDSILDSMSSSLRSISLITSADFQQVVEWNKAVAPATVSAQCDEMIALHLGSRGHEQAVCGFDLSLTYFELDAMADAVAQHLVSKYSISSNMIVPFCFEKSSWAIVVMLGILKAGAAFVPLDHLHPVDRLAGISHRVAAPVVVCSETNEQIGRSLSSSTGIPHLVIGSQTIGSLKAKSKSARAARAISTPRKPSDLAYCLFTSGSTGTPKGVLIRHEALCSGATMHGDAFNYTSQARVLQFASYVFDACITEILTTLIKGGCICVPSEEQRMNPDELMEFITERQVNHALLTPSVLALLDPVQVPSIATLLLGGEAATPELIHKWRAASRRVLVAYGPTECTVICAGHDATAPERVPSGKSLIGSSVGSAGWLSYPHDHNRLVPVGSIGELLVEGPILAEGYLDDEVKTTAAFVYPTWAGGNRRMYRTGDLVRHLGDGTLEYLGRRDNQVKLRGQRLELGEIEGQLLRHPEVKQAAVLLMKKGLCDDKIVAVLALKDKLESRVTGRLSFSAGSREGIEIMSGEVVTSTTASIDQALADVLPHYMIPSIWFVTEKLPLMPSGKTDRRFLNTCISNISKEMYQLCTGQQRPDSEDQLREPAEAEGAEVEVSHDSGVVERGSGVAEIIRQVWSEVLDLDPQSIDISAGSFVNLGGDSISAMEVVAQCRAKGIPVLIQQLLKAKSIKQVAAHFEHIDLPGSGTDSNVLAANKTSPDEEADQGPEDEDTITLFGLSPIQRMFTRASPGQNHFNQSFLLRVSTDRMRVSESEVRRALDAIVRRHSMLRARFQKLGRSFKQWIEPAVESSYVFQSWKLGASSSFPAAAVAHVHQTQQSLDLENGPVFAGDLLDVGNEQYIFLTAHHLVIDLVSWRIVLKDLEDYLVSGAISPYKSISFEKWCGLLSTQRKALAGSAVIPCEVPSTDYNYWGMAGKPNYSSDFEHHQFTLPAPTSALLLGSCNGTLGTEPLDLFISAIMHSFAATFQDRPIPPIFNEGHGREPWSDSIDLSRTVGWFTTIAPVWVDAEKCDKNILQYVRETKNFREKTPSKGFSYFSSLEFEKRPFTMEVTFNYFGAFQQLDREGALLKQVHWRNLGVDPCEASEKTKRFSLIEISAEIESQQLVFTFSFNSNIARQDDIHRWISNYQKSLEQLTRALGEQAQPVTFPSVEMLGVPESNVEDVYACLPSQQGMLLSQAKDSELYWFRSVYEVQSAGNIAVTSQQLHQAWRAVVQHHPVLRTIFVEQDSSDGLYDQLVLAKYEPQVNALEVDGVLAGAEFIESLKIGSISSDMLSHRVPQHLLHIVRQPATGKMFVSFLISHTIADGFSMGVLIRDFGLACQGQRLCKDQPLLRNYTEHLNSRDAAADIDFWKQSLDGIDPCLLPAETSLLPSKALGKVDVPVEKVNYIKLQNAARKIGVSLFTMLQVTWALTLREYINADREECAFGVVTAGRDLPVKGIQDMVGPLVNILVARVMLPHDQTVTQILEAVHDGFIDNLAHQTSSLAEITHELGAGALFNTGMTLQKAGKGEEVSKLVFKPVGGQDPTEFDMVVQALDDGQRLRVHLGYWRDKVSDSRAANMADSFASILGQIVQNPDIRPTDLHMASEKDVQQLWTWNATLPPSIDLRIEEMIAQRTAEHPQREALWSTGETLTYQQLDILSTRVAREYLAGIEREEAVPLCFEKSVWIVVAMIAVLKVGGTVVLMDHSHPAERLKCIVDTVQARRVLASPAQAEMCRSQLGLPTVTISKDTLHGKPGGRAALPKKETSSSDAAYVVFTSGSTGTPKGSVTEHHSFSTAMSGYHQAIGQLPGERVLQFASYSFDASFLEIFGSLMVGATVCVPTETERGNHLVSFINKSKTTFAVITPSVASIMRPEDIPTLKSLALCGEPMTASHISTWSDKVRLVNAFGPSECCVGSAANSPVTIKSSPKCIGKAVSCCYWVVHPRNHNRLSRIGNIGELLIEGPILARHYLNEPVKTAAAFINSPEWARTGRGTRLYKTGDLVYQNADGSFQYVGRKDTQAKIRGQRLEFGDVEQAFRDVFPNAENVVAEIVPGKRSPRLVVFFSAKGLEIATVESAKLQAKMAQKVPAYMVPSTIVPLERMPLMPSGKIDRKRIKALGAALPTRQAPVAAGQASHPTSPVLEVKKVAGRPTMTEMEITLAALWKGVLKNAPEHILADHSFFKVGGDSYTAMKLVTAARAKGVLLSVATIMQTPKLSDMALKAGQKLNKSAAAPTNTAALPFSMVDWTPELEEEVSRQCGVAANNIEDVYPCTALQEGLFVLSVKQTGAYVARHCYRVPRAVDLERYKQAWETIYRESAILRTHIVQLDGADKKRASGLYQVAVNKPIVWQRASSLDAFAAAAQRVTLGGALAQFAVVDNGNDNNRYVVITMHHAAYDAASLGMLLDDVETVYNGQQLPARLAFREIIKQLEGGQIQEARQFWAKYLEGAQPLDFPRVPSGYVPSSDSIYDYDITLPGAISMSHTMATVIRVAWGMVLGRHGNVEDVVFGETISGRNSDGDGIVAEVQGPLITTVPVRLALGQEDCVVEVLDRMQASLVEMIPYQQAGLQNIRSVSPSAAAACGFGCLITIAPEASVPGGSGLGIEPVDVGSPPVMSHPLSVQFILGEKGTMKISVIHDKRLVDGVQVRKMVKEFVGFLERLCEGEKKRVRDVTVVTDAEESATLEIDTSGVMHGDMEEMLEDISSHRLSKPASEVGGQRRRVKEVEAEMRRLWAEILKMQPEEIGDQDNFFELGGDSISSMRLVTAAERKEIAITVADIFQHPSLGELCTFAAHSRGEEQQDTVRDAQSIPELYEEFGVIDQLGLERGDIVKAVCKQLSVFPADIEDVYPATDYQAWAVSHGLMRSRGNTNYFLFRLHGELDTFRLEQACRKMVASNPILRTLFTTIGGQVMQVVVRSYQIEFMRYGSEHMADDNFIQWLVSQDTQRSAYLSQSIVRFKLVRTSDQYVLIMRMSHAQYDGMSMPLIIRDLAKAYNGQETEPRPSFGKFIQGTTYREGEAIKFWGDLLNGSSITQVVEHAGPTYKHNVDTVRTRTLPPMPVNVAGMSQATLVKAAWALVLAKMSGQRDIVFGNLIFGRNLPVSGVEEMAGPCINIIPVRVKVDAMDSIQHLLALVQEQQMAAMPHENLGFRRLIKNCTDWPHWARFSSVVQHQQQGRDGGEGQEFTLADNLRCEMGVLGPAYDSSDLWVQTTPLADSFKVEIGSCSSIVQPAIAEMLLDKLCATLSIFASLAAGPDCHLWELLARDGPPLIPIKSSIVDQVWSKVLPDADTITWDTPYFEIWGDEIAPVRFLEEYAQHGIHFDMEDILENPTKQAQMILVSRIQSELENRRGRRSPRSHDEAMQRGVSRDSLGLGGSVASPVSETTRSNSRGFFVIGSQSRKQSCVVGTSSGSRDDSISGSPLVASPRLGAIVPRRGMTLPMNGTGRKAGYMSPSSGSGSVHGAVNPLSGEGGVMMSPPSTPSSSDESAGKGLVGLTSPRLRALRRETVELGRPKLMRMREQHKGQQLRGW